MKPKEEAMPLRYGVAAPEEIAGLTGLEMLRAMVEGRLPAPTIAQTLGFTLVDVSPGAAVFEGEAGPHLLNPLGTVHGGFALTLVDSAAGCAVHTTLPAGIGYTTVETKVNFTGAIRADSGTIRAEGRVVAQGKSISTAEARVLSGAGKLLAHGTSTLMILQPRG
jgi:uncharacterized protein (TIGR00369 family)